VAIDPKPGLVVRYDYLWKDEEVAGLESGKDRPCAIILVAKARADGSRQVILCAITHSPPTTEELATSIPPKVARHLGLDDQPSWIKTNEVNVLTWEKNRIPYGISPVRQGTWVFGEIPASLAQMAFDQVREKARQGLLNLVRRDI
jgi:hypothetical protein